MTHPAPERLALVALDEGPLDETEAGHLRACQDCRKDLDELQDVAALGRHTQRLRELPAPPDHVWARIRAELTAPPPEPAPAPADDARRRRRPGVIALVVAVAATAGAAGALAGTVLTSARDNGADCRRQDARVRLEAVGGPPGGGTGYACVRPVDGRRTIVVRADGLPVQQDADYEAWLLDATGPGAGLMPLGLLGRGPSVTVRVPAGMNLTQYNIIDISIEPRDGAAGHSGRSVLRARLP